MFVVPEKELWRVSGWLKDLSGDAWVLAIHVLELPVDDDALMARAMPVIRISSNVRYKYVFDRAQGRKLTHVALAEITLSFSATDWVVARAGHPQLLESWQRLRVPEPITVYHQLIPRRVQHVRHTR